LRAEKKNAESYVFALYEMHSLTLRGNNERVWFLLLHPLHLTHRTAIRKIGAAGRIRAEGDGRKREREVVLAGLRGKRSTL